MTSLFCAEVHHINTTKHAWQIISAWQIKEATKREERRGLTLLGDGRAAKPETAERGEDPAGWGRARWHGDERPPGSRSSVARWRAEASDLLAADRARRGDERRRRASEARAASGGEARAARAELGFGESKGSGKKKVGEKASWPTEPFFTLSPGNAWRIPQRCATDKLCVAHHIGVRHNCLCIVQNAPKCYLDNNLHLA
jgi:hypothetical protein